MRDSLTLPGILKSISGNEMIPSSFPDLSTTIVANICRRKESQKRASKKKKKPMKDLKMCLRNLPGRFQHMLKTENCKNRVTKFRSR